MNNFQTARRPHPEPAADPFAFLERLPREDWEIAFCRFHGGVRRTSAHPAEVVAWVRRDVDSTLADLDRLSRTHPLYSLNVEALRTFGKALAQFPAEAEALAGHALHVESTMEIYRECRRSRSEASA